MPIFTFISKCYTLALVVGGGQASAAAKGPGRRGFRQITARLPNHCRAPAV